MQKVVSDRVDALRAALEEADRRTNEQWLATLSARKLAEIEFHDEDRDISAGETSAIDAYERETANKKYYSTVESSSRYVREWLERNAAGKVFLDYACGAGEKTLAAARAGATLAVGLDISRVSVENCRVRAREEGLADNTFFIQGDCENTGLPAESFDTILCSGMLHHLDLSFAFPEIRRLLKPGGRCLAIEALNYNPAIKLYRWLTPSMRTEWEKRHILSLKDVRFARRFFHVENLRYWHLFSVLATPLRTTGIFGPALKAANALDRVALRVPGLAQMAWMFTFEMVKPAE
jgi:SAM-dependent methyltransferase